MSKRKSPLGIGFWILVAFGGVGGYFIGKIGGTGRTADLNATPILIAIAFIPAFLIVLATHEAGHAITGILVRFDFRMFVVGPFLWEKEAGKWKFKWNKNINTAGGLVLCLPTDSLNIGRRFALYAAGGPLASLFLTGISFLLFLFLDGGPIAHLFFFIGAFSLMIFIVTIIPSQMGGFSSDGARILKFLRGGEEGQLEVLMLKLFGSSTSGIRPKDLDRKELEEAAALAGKLKSSIEVYIISYQYHFAFDNRNYEEAERMLQKYVDRADEIPAGIRNGVWLDAAFFYAIAKRDLEEALKYWNMFTPAALIPKAQIHATDAAIDILKGEPSQALVKSQLARAELKNMMDSGGAVALKERLDEMEGISR